MPVEVKVPSFGESIKEGVIVKWLRQSGAYVRADEDLVEIETEKATSAVPSPAAGALNITVPEGRKVLIGAIIGQIDEKATVPVAKLPSKPAAKPAEPTKRDAEPKKEPEPRKQ